MSPFATITHTAQSVSLAHTSGSRTQQKLEFIFENPQSCFFRGAPPKLSRQRDAKFISPGMRIRGASETKTASGLNIG
jgi:hypothetical protein